MLIALNGSQFATIGLNGTTAAYVRQLTFFFLNSSRPESVYFLSETLNVIIATILSHKLCMSSRCVHHKNAKQSIHDLFVCGVIYFFFLFSILILIHTNKRIKCTTVRHICILCPTQCCGCVSLYYYFFFHVRLQTCSSASAYVCRRRYYKNTCSFNFCLLFDDIFTHTTDKIEKMTIKRLNDKIYHDANLHTHNII